jgi:predicted RNA-binding Zn-ribbon protein involved in translation (DUF1610 family)
MAICKKCKADFHADLHDDPKTGALMFNCPKCGTKHIAHRRPTPQGAPIEFDIELANE